MIFFILEVNEALLKLLFSFKFSFDELCVRADDIFDLFLEFDSLIHVYFLFFLSFFFADWKAEANPFSTIIFPA